MENGIYHSKLLYNYFKKLNLCRVFPQTAIKHIMSILISVFSLGYHGKTIDFENTAPATVPRLPISSIKENGMMSGSKTYLKALSFSSSIMKPGGLESPCSALWMIRSLPKQSLRHRLCTQLKMRISTSPISRESKQDYGHQAVAVMLSCNGIVLNYAMPSSCTISLNQK